MILIKTICVEDFRGIHHLDLDLAGKNFGICGPNGTGKSGVVDAIEFCLTGDVTRLTGHGTMGLSVKSHAPHVDQRSHPEKANVTITANIPSLGKTVKIHRSVKNPKTVEITPNDSAITSIVVELGTHPEFALSRREIVKYILTPPGQRSVDVQTLLRLDHIERLRKAFTAFSNKRKREYDEAKRYCSQAEFDLRNALRIDNLNQALVLERVNEKRQILGLSILTELRKDTSFKAGVPEPQEPEKKMALRKAVALAELGALKAELQSPEPTALVGSRQAAKDALERFRDDEQALTLARRHGLIKTGLELVTEDACPLCDTPWKVDDLREHLYKKILSAEVIKNLVDQLRSNINNVLEFLVARIEAIECVQKYIESLKPHVPLAETTAYYTNLKETETALKEYLEDHSRVTSALKAVTDSWWLPTTEQLDRISECQSAANALPDTSVEDEARDILSVAQDRYERLLKASRNSAGLQEQNAIAQKVLDHYNSTALAVLEGIYDQVAQSFSTYYRAINLSDEDRFVGKLISEPAKLSFNVDFYGRGLFPPGAYHSEGHQDAMGLCLYLALMKHTLGDKFTFAVLDDVLMSVDTGHRRAVCRLLKKEFPNTQFILTTHDRVWLQYMKTENLISRSQSFGGWTVDLGPRVWEDHDIWTEIKNELAKDNVVQAAWLLRHYLEYTAVILADNLRARIEFRGDGQYDLADLMPHVLKRWRTLLEGGEKCATKWKLEKEMADIMAMRIIAKKLIAKTNIEQWAINPSVHFNEWVNLRAHEFQDVVHSFKELFEHLRCDNPACKSYLYVLPKKGQPEEMRCNCGASTINIKSRA